MCRMGCAEVIITDQGREFVNSLSAQLYQKTNTQHRITSAYHPQTNGLTERFNQTLSRCLAKTVNDNQDNWDEKINTILMGYRASRQASIKHSPYFMLFQAEMRLPIDSELLPGQPEERTPEEVIEHLLKSREEVFTTAEANIKSAQGKQKETYDRKHQQVSTLSVGMKVLLENTAQKQRKGGKLDSRWLGPYFINRDLGKLLLFSDNSYIYTACMLYS